MKVSEATRARRREASRTGHQLPAAMANALLWDTILQTSERVNGLPVVRFHGSYYLVAEGNPWPTFRQRCVLLARPDDPRGDLCITSLGLVEAFDPNPKRRGLRRPVVHGVQDDIQPVLSIPVAGAGATARAVRPAVPGAGPVPNHEQLPGGIHGRLPGGDQSELPSKGGA